MSRNASLGIDGVYYNPAGLIKLENGWHFSLNNQTIFQTRIIDSKFPLLNDGYYEGDVTIPLFPTAFAVYKKDKWAFSFGFGPNAGGGSAMYERGMPSFEIPISKLASGYKQLAPLMAIYNAPGVVGETGYNAQLSLDGSSVYFGFQIGATYEISNMFSIFGGVRYMSANNTYLGAIKNIEFETSVGNMAATDYQVMTSPILVGTIQTLDETSEGMQQAIDAGLIDPNSLVSDPQLLQILTLLGYPEATNQQAIGIMKGGSATLNTLNSSDVSDKEVDTKQTGAGFTPILGVNISPNENWNIGIRYEHKTYMTVENNTTVDDLDLFPDGAESRADVPGILGIGVGYKDKKWEAQVSYNYYFDKYVDWGGNIRDISVWKDKDPSQIRAREIENNSFDIALGLQYNLTEKFSLSAGAMYQKAGVADSYNSDFSFAPDSYVALGGGIMWKITDQLTLDAGVSYITYKDAEVSYFDPDLNSSYAESYGRESFSFAVGLSYSIFR
jgi:long-subunit fatty acid transport protein